MGGAIKGVVIATCILLGILALKTNDYQDQIYRLGKDMLTIENNVSVKAGNWIQYLESRVNRLAKSQDEYQFSTSKRIDYLADKVSELEKRVHSLELQVKEKGDSPISKSSKQN